MVSQELIDAVNQQDAEKIRALITAISFHNRGFHDGKFDEAIDYVRKHEVPGLWQAYKAYDGEEFKKNREEWNAEYWAYLNGSLNDNFCEERIAHLKEVGRYLYPMEAKVTESPVPSRQDETREKHTESQRSSRARSTARRVSSQSDLPPAAWLVGGAAILLLGCATIGVTKTLVATAAVAGGAFFLTKR